MTPYEYKVIPAPTRGQKGKGVKGADGRFAHALETAMNEMAAIGWEYQRAETLPSEERAGLTSKTTVFRNVLVFRRPADTDIEAFAPKLLEASEIETLDDTPATEEPDTQSEHEDDADNAPTPADPLLARAEQLNKPD